MSMSYKIGFFSVGVGDLESDLSAHIETEDVDGYLDYIR